jgi:ribosomal protein L11 methyltransferase
MSWLELSVEVDPEAVESVSELLAQYGYNGGVVVDQPIIPGEDGPEYTFDTGRPVMLRTYLPLNDRAEDTRARLEQALWHFGRMRPIGPLQSRTLQEEDWANAWKRYYTIQQIGERTVIVPSWLEHEPQPGEIIIRLDPGMAFGTGLHPTTRLCLALLEGQIIPGQSVLDLGSGSGILAIAAALLGASQVLALDTDPIAVEASAANAERNGVADRVISAEGSLGRGAELGGWVGSTEPQNRRTAELEEPRTQNPEPIIDDSQESAVIDTASHQPPATSHQPQRAGEPSSIVHCPSSQSHQPPATFDLIVANILARVLAAPAPDLAGALAPGGKLVSSGIIADREDEVTLAYAAAGLERIERRQEGDWVALVHRKPAA